MLFIHTNTSELEVKNNSIYEDETCETHEIVYYVNYSTLIFVSKINKNMLMHI